MLTFPDCESCRSDVDNARRMDVPFLTDPTQDLNVPLLMQVLLAIHTQPERWDQRYFFGRLDCGTTRCVAGWTLSLSGIDQDLDGSYAEHAQALLGLSDDEREHVFYHLQTDDLNELTDTVHALLAHRGLAPKELSDACTV